MTNAVYFMISPTMRGIQICYSGLCQCGGNVAALLYGPASAQVIGL